MDYETLRRVNDKLIYCSISAFGPEGPESERPGYDPVFQCLGGVMTFQGFGGPPQYVRLPVTDLRVGSMIPA